MSDSNPPRAWNIVIINLSVILWLGMLYVAARLWLRSQAVVPIMTGETITHQAYRSYLAASRSAPDLIVWILRAQIILPPLLLITGLMLEQRSESFTVPLWQYAALGLVVLPGLVGAYLHLTQPVIDWQQAVGNGQTDYHAIIIDGDGLLVRGTGLELTVLECVPAADTCQRLPDSYTHDDSGGELPHYGIDFENGDDRVVVSSYQTDERVLVIDLTDR